MDSKYPIPPRRRLQDVVYTRKLVAGLNAPEPGPTPLSTDSQSARDVSYNPEHHDRMKHVARRHFFVRDMVEEFELEVPFVRTDDNSSDMLTKPMKSVPKFFQFRAFIMNELDYKGPVHGTPGRRPDSTAAA